MEPPETPEPMMGSFIDVVRFFPSSFDAHTGFGFSYTSFSFKPHLISNQGSMLIAERTISYNNDRVFERIEENLKYEPSLLERILKKVYGWMK